MDAVVRERLERMGIAAYNEVRPIVQIEYVSRPLFDEDGATVAARSHEGRIQVCRLYPDHVQEAAINACLSRLLS